MNLRYVWPGGLGAVPYVWRDLERQSEKFYRLAELARMSRFDVLAEQYDAVAGGIAGEAIARMYDGGPL